jgi:hypothetical protein
MNAKENCENGYRQFNGILFLGGSPNVSADGRVSPKNNPSTIYGKYLLVFRFLKCSNQIFDCAKTAKDRLASQPEDKPDDIHRKNKTDHGETGKKPGRIINKKKCRPEQPGPGYYGKKNHLPEVFHPKRFDG